jgi:hypothetical protein
VLGGMGVVVLALLLGRRPIRGIDRVVYRTHESTLLREVAGIYAFAAPHHYGMGVRHLRIAEGTQPWTATADTCDRTTSFGGRG